MNKGSRMVPDSTSKSIFAPILAFWYHSDCCHTRTCGFFFLCRVLLMSVDVATDLYTGLTHFQNGDVIWGTQTILVMFLPFLATFGTFITSFIWFKVKQHCHKDPEKPMFSSGWQHLPFVQAFRNLHFFIGLVTMDTTNPHNFPLVSTLKSSATDITATEALLESAPQLVLQIYIILSIGHISLNQTAGIIISFTSLFWTSLNLFFSARVLEEKEGSPNWRFMLGVAPFVLLDLLGSVLLLSLLAVFIKGIGLAVAIAIIIAVNLILQKKWGYSYEFEVMLDSALEENTAQHELSSKEITQTLRLSTFTSWIINTVVVYSKTNLHLISSAITISMYFLLTTSAILYQVLIKRHSIEDYSLIVCSPQNLTTELSFENIIWIFFNSTPALQVFTNTSNHQTVRVCRDEEQPTSILLNLIIPLVTLSVIFKVLTNFVLHLLSDYNRLVEWLKTIGINFFYYIDVIERPIHFKEKDLLFNNIDFVNKQHPLTGETMLHKAELLGLTPEETFKLQKKGANVNLEDFGRKTAKNSWTDNYRRQFEDILRKDGEEECLRPQKDLNHLLTFIEKGQPKWLHLFVILGSKLEAKDHSGNNIIEHVAAKVILEDNQAKNFSFLKALPLENVLEILMMVILSMSINTDEEESEVTEKAYFIRQYQEKIFSKCQSVKLNQKKFYFSYSKCIENILSEVSQNMWTQVKNPFLFYACEKGLNNLTRQIFKWKCDPNIKNDTGKTPLQIASLYGHSGCVILLLESKADPNVKDTDGNTPLHDASENGHTECVKLLLEAKADPNVGDKYQRTPLHWASYYGHSDSVNLLLESKADPNVKNDFERTPLHDASKNGHANCVKLLLASKADSNVKDEDGRTPLGWASENGLTDCVKLLLEAKADPNVGDKYQRTPLHWASYYGHSDCVKLLLASKADPTAVDYYYQRTPLK